MWDCVVVRYSEIAIKSDPVRLRFEKILANNVHKALKEKGIDFKVSRKRGRIIVKADNTDEVCDSLKYVFGIVSFSPAKHVELEDLRAFIEDNLDELVPKEPFAIRVKRAGKHPFTSKDIEEKIGSLVVKKTGKKVDLSSPESTLYIEIRESDAYIYNSVIPGPMGMPLGSQGKAYCFIEDDYGILACWLVMKRGCKVNIFHTFPVDILDMWSPGIEIKKEKVSSVVNVKKLLKDEKEPTVLGDNLTQKNLSEIKNEFYCTFRPLIGYDEEMIKKLKKKVNCL